MSVRVTDRVQWAAEQFLPSGINVIKRGNVQGLLRFSVVQRERERASTGMGQKAGAEPPGSAVGADAGISEAEKPIHLQD